MSNQSTDMSTLMGKLKQKDKKYAQINKALMIIYAVIIPLFLVMITIDVFKKTEASQIFRDFYILIPFIIFFIILKKTYKRFQNVDYNKSALDMLRDVVKRYRLLSPETIWSIVALVIISLQPVLSYGLNRIPIIESLITAAIFSIALVAGAIWWYISYKPIADSAKTLIKEIES